MGLEDGLLMFRRLLKYPFILLLLLPCSLPAQNNERQDSLVRLLGCDQLQQIEERGINYRKAIGHARFEHNGTKLLCDTALWNTKSNIIEANGHVRIIQNTTVLSSDNLDYIIDANMAHFRGAVVQLQDKDRNTLRTRHLDYYTKDSVATFKGGGAFRDKDGQIIESDEGTYDAKLKEFKFRRNVNMYTDSIFVKTESLDYDAGTSVAVFGAGTNAWKDDNMLSAKSGWYDRAAEEFTFIRDVHLMTPGQEAWSDTLKYYRIPGDAEMFGNVELLDTSRNIMAVAGYMQYIDSLQYIKMTRDPAVIGITEQDGARDTVYAGADVFIYWTVPKCAIPESEITASEERLKDINLDPISEYRRKAAEDARAAAEEAKRKMAEDDPNAAGATDRGRDGGGPSKGGGGKRLDQNLPAPWDDSIELDIPLWEFGPQIPDTLKHHTDTTVMPGDTTVILSEAKDLPVPEFVEGPADTLAVSDTLSVPLDSTRIGFLQGIGHVKVFRKDMQVSCDSLAYNDLDSLIRLYKSPLVWNEIKRQYSADSIAVMVKGRSLDRASLMSNAFIIVQEDSICFDQIKGTDMMAYFDSTGALKRFDSMGGSSGVFFIEEKGAFATVNKFEAKMLTAAFKDGSLYDLNYFDDVKSDAYPVVQLKKDERILKGFEWQPEKRPKGPEDITSYTPRKSERGKYEKVPRAKFVQTDIYFPGYMEDVYKMLASQDSIKRVRRAAAPVPEPVEGPADTTAVPPAPELVEGTEPAADTTVILSEAKDLTAPEPVEGSADTLVLDASQIDSLLAGQTIDALRSKVPDDPKAALKAKQKAEKEARKAEQEKIRQEKDAKKQAKWAALDAKDAEKAAKKAAKELEKQRAKTLKLLKARAEREAKEQKAIERYKAKYEKRKARQDARAAKKQGKKASAS